MIIPNLWENKIDVPNHQPEHRRKTDMAMDTMPSLENINEPFSSIAAMAMWEGDTNWTMANDLQKDSNSTEDIRIKNGIR